ncbi:metal ABC transporter ATP-binding protein [Staphylococcus warneri]|jgi:zinc transport system ATP-binding protein|uniref:Metal ABC transporter ATP-binding protein n=2 Tax=Staphylococcus warneri TaxID=1292 RepID=A0A2T4PEH9_STAWA|nr:MULTISPECIES: metal ABC transporter ATP-binding protein [Staphylococcus]MBE9428386.1 metal ABC transporter ATP-binding protein [Staphylococcus epidermidis]POO68929.1 metal ABC transporter ATP-binding protein [Bacillus amyloliquefaciens]SKR88232.1 glutamine ABC transporter ATP-binding protein [Mycobacteroides abscessus subsp. abscessus]AGC90504.1 ABC transporter ATP-binding protein [Staphylococcus warneri SG1]AXV42282.1 zinc ABC transporter [Staphylococcus sp. M0911]
MTTPVFELKNIDYYFDHKQVLENINIKINKGEFLAIVGPNGAGKSTLLKIILGLLPLQSGEIFIDGHPIKNNKSSLKISYVSQKASSFTAGFPASVKEVVLSGLTKTKKLFQRFNQNDVKQVEHVLERLNISHLIHKNIAELSGGQQQRVLIARALISNPSVLVLDEPTNGIDAKHVNEFYETLDRLKKEGITIILVTHDIGVVADTATEVACLNKHLHFHGTTEDFKSLDEVEISKIYGHPIQFVDHQHNRECCN